MVAAMGMAAAHAALNPTKGSASPAQTNCEGCGAPLEPQRPTCTHCRRPRRNAEPSPGYSYKGADRWPTPDRPPMPPVDLSVAYGYSRPLDPSLPYGSLGPSFPTPETPGFGSGGGGDFSGGGATGEW